MRIGSNVVVVVRGRHEVRGSHFVTGEYYGSCIGGISQKFIVRGIGGGTMTCRGE